MNVCCSCTSRKAAVGPLGSFDVAIDPASRPQYHLLLLEERRPCHMLDDAAFEPAVWDSGTATIPVRPTGVIGESAFPKLRC